MPGKEIKKVNPKLFVGLDWWRGLKTERKGATLTLDSKMSAAEAGACTAKILREWGLYDAEDEGVSVAVLRQVLLSFALNQTSANAPLRSVINYGGREFKMLDLYTTIGPENVRRYARAYADQIRDVVRSVLRGATFDDYDMADLREEIYRIANARGMQRHPDLCFDVADHCTGLAQNERNAIASAKEIVLTSTVNAVDRGLATGRAIGADGFDSGTGAVNESAAGTKVGGSR